MPGFPPDDTAITIPSFSEDRLSCRSDRRGIRRTVRWFILSNTLFIRLDQRRLRCLADWLFRVRYKSRYGTSEMLFHIGISEKTHGNLQIWEVVYLKDARLELCLEGWRREGNYCHDYTPPHPLLPAPLQVPASSSNVCARIAGVTGDDIAPRRYGAHAVTDTDVVGTTMRE